MRARNGVLLAASALGCERDGRVLFSALDLELKRGDLVELTGSNGSGKTTLLRILAGLCGDYAGRVDRDGHEAGWLHYLGHRAGLSAALSPLENLRWYTSVAGSGDARDEHRLKALARVGLAGYEDTPCHQLSAGQQRRAALARLIAHVAKVWLLDEPLTALDTDGARLVRALLVEHRARGGAAICATHQPLGVDGARSLVLGAPA
jgi:heme exporter protein A